MCGILGWYCWGEQRPDPDFLPKLLNVNENRGRDAAGIAFLDDDKLRIIKNEGPASKLIYDISAGEPEVWARAAKSKIVLGHTRAATKGNVDNNNNNHPIILGDWVVVHNGQVYNDDELFSATDVERPAEVDSIAIPLVLSEVGLGGLGLLAGAASLAAWNSKTADELVLAKLGYNEIFLFYQPDQQMLVFSSDKNAGLLVDRKSIGGLGFSHVSCLPDERVLILRPALEKSELMGLTRKRFFGQGPKTKSAEPAFSRFKWTNENFETEFRGSRTPDFTKCEPITYENYNQEDVLQLDLHRGPQTLYTPYGRWESNGTGTFEFKPHKSIKKFHEINKLPKWWADPSQNSIRTLDGLLSWERIRLVEKHDDISLIVPGVVCPWCGILYKGVVVRENLWTCEWCYITSKPLRTMEESN